MAKYKKTVTVTYYLFPSASGDLWADKRYTLDSTLTQTDLKHIFELGFDNYVYKKED